MNKLEASLSQNDLNSLFSTKVEKASNNYFYIMTNTHKIYIKNPQITWEQPYTEPNGATIKYVDTTETVIAPTSTTRTELFFNGVATIDKEHPNKSDVENWLNQLAAHKTFIKWIVNQTQWSIKDVSCLPNDVENIWISKPVTLSESNTAQVTINIGRMNKTYVVKLAKPLDVDYIKAIVEFPVNDDEFVVSLRSSTQVKCTSGFTLSEHIAVPDTTQLGSILKSGVKEARTALNKHNQ